MVRCYVLFSVRTESLNMIWTGLGLSKSLIRWTVTISNVELCLCKFVHMDFEIYFPSYGRDAKFHIHVDPPHI